MIEVEVQNFQSVERVSLTIDGFTAIAGRSNIGKSSIVRAIQAALTGAAGTDFVRHGPSCERRLKGNKKCKCQTTVHIKMPELELVWEKGDAKNQYTVVQDGEKKVYTAVDRGTPDFLLPDFKSVKIGSSNELIQVSEQFSPIFLLDQSGPAIADVLSDVARLDSINDALRLAGKERKEANATRKVREKDIADLNDALEAYEGLDGAVARVQDVERGFAGIQPLQESLDLLGLFIVKTVKLVAGVNALAEATKPKLPDYEGLGAKGKEVSQLSEWLAEILVRAPVVRRLRGVEKVVPPDITFLVEIGLDLNRLSGWLERAGELQAGFQDLKDAVAVPEPDRRTLTDKAETFNWLAQCQEREATLLEEVGQLTAQLAAAKKEEGAILEGYRELGVCPTCSQSIERHDCPADNGLLCEVCNEPQNGHGGAGSVEP